jgi:hypothetical protein
VINTLNVSYNSRRSVTLSGTVTDFTCGPGGLTITFGGKVHATTVTDAAGNFTLTTNADGLGDVTAVTTDAMGIGSNTAIVTLGANAPVITNFTSSEGAGHGFTFTGTVSDQSPAGLTVSFGGIPSLAGQTATVSSNGTFSLAVVLNADGSDNGMAWAQTVDWWGLTSNQPTTNVYVS